MLFLLVPFLYLLTGVFIARSVNAHQRAGQSASINRTHNSINHGSACYQKRGGRHYRPHLDCDCAHYTEWARLPKGNNVTNPYLVMIGWPGMGLHHFMTSGSVEDKSVDALNQKIDSLERELSMGAHG